MLKKSLNLRVTTFLLLKKVNRDLCTDRYSVPRQGMPQRHAEIALSTIFPGTPLRGNAKLGQRIIRA